MSEPQQTVFIVDDDPSFLKGIERLLRSSGYATECFSSAEEFLARCSREAEGCVVTDLRMPGMDGLSLQKSLASLRNPLAVVFLTGQGDIPTSVRAMRAGAEDFLSKTAPREEIIDAVDRALARSRVECREAAVHESLQSRIDSLTPRERVVLSRVIRGDLNKVIAAELGINERSVKRHRSHLMSKLQVDSLAELVRLTIEAGFEFRD